MFSPRWVRGASTKACSLHPTPKYESHARGQVGIDMQKRLFTLLTHLLYYYLLSFLLS